MNHLNVIIFLQPPVTFCLSNYTLKLYASTESREEVCTQSEDFKLSPPPWAHVYTLMTHPTRLMGTHLPATVFIGLNDTRLRIFPCVSANVAAVLKISH